jgi:LysM repeat protein
MLETRSLPGKLRLHGALSLLLALTLALSIFLLAGSGTASAANQSYTVQNGDNLTGIAARFGLSVAALANANGLANVNNIYAGQVLIIPQASGPNSNNSPAPASTGEGAYIVQAGDTLSGIALQFGVSLSDLASANKISVMSYVYIGQTLRIPGQSAAPTPTPAATPTPAKAPTTTAPAQGNASGPVQNSVSGSVYTVQPGDSLSGIAARFSTTVAALQQANSIANPNSIFVGQKLVIPPVGQTGAVAPVVSAPNPVQPAASASTSGKWIDVNLSQQRLVAYEGSKAVFSSLVSTGVARHPTVTGTFNIYLKYTSQAMTGGTGAEYYYLPGVPYVMYFYESYAIHGTYWHNNFGHVMSHGCVNMPTDAAKFMFNWAPMGTPVTVHY